MTSGTREEGNTGCFYWHCFSSDDAPLCDWPLRQQFWNKVFLSWRLNRFREALNQLHGRYGGCILWCCCPRAVDIVETEPNTSFTDVSVVENLDNATENRRCPRFAFRPLIKIMRNQITQLVGRQKMNHEEFWWINCLSESLFKRK